MKHLAAIGLVLVVIIAACGDASRSEGGATSSAAPSTASPTTTATTAPEDAEELGSVGRLLSVALVDEGFTTEEADCLSREFNATFGDDGLAEMLLADEPPPEFARAVDEYVIACLSPERLEEFAATESPDSSNSTIEASLSCRDPEDDIRSEFSGWTPSIPWGMGDVTALDFSIEDGVLTVTLRTPGTHPPTGGPGSTPFIVRMYLVTGDEAGPVAYDVELMRSDNVDDPPGPILVTTVDGLTGEWLAEESYEDVITGPGMITASIPVAAVEPVVASDFWLEIRTEWGPDHPIGSDAELEWMIDSACDGPHLVTVEGGDPLTNAATGSWSPKTIDELRDPVVFVNDGFGRGLPEGWYEQIWMKAADAGDEVTEGDGIRFAGLGGSTRSGIMIDVKKAVRDYSHLVLAISGAVLEQSLAGTGWHGREAPLAVTVTYVDVDGTRHVGLAEDPTSPTNMFYLGFTALPEAEMVNGVAVEAGEPFVYQFDLMGLDPKPARILSLGIEGGGWAPRIGEVYEVVMAAGD